MNEVARRADHLDDDQRPPSGVVEAVADEHLPHEYGKRRKHDGRQYEAVPEKLQADPALGSALGGENPSRSTSPLTRREEST
jgi:hypothetical protein